MHIFITLGLLFFSFSVIAAPVNFKISLLQSHQDPNQKSNDVVISTESKTKTIQTLQVGENQPAFISTGKTIPLLTQAAPESINNNGGVNYTYKQLETGFYVNAKKIGNKAEVHVIYVHETDNNNNLQHQRSETTLTLPFNRWVLLSSNGNEEQNDQTVISTENKNPQAMQLWLKISLN